MISVNERNKQNAFKYFRKSDNSVCKFAQRNANKKMNKQNLNYQM